MKPVKVWIEWKCLSISWESLLQNRREIHQNAETVCTTRVISSGKYRWSLKKQKTINNKLNSASYLQHREVGLAWQAEFLLLWGVGVEAVLVQPAPQNLHRLLGQVAAATALPKEPPSWQVERGAVIAVRHGRGVLLLRAMLFFQSWGSGGDLSVTVTVCHLVDMFTSNQCLVLRDSVVVFLCVHILHGRSVRKVEDNNLYDGLIHFHGQNDGLIYCYIQGSYT